LRRFLKCFRRFWFRLKIELECGFNKKPGKLMTRKAGLGNQPRHSGKRRRVTS